jgi:DNA-binding response OmpR family regulator
VPTGDRVIEAARQLRPDLILLDANLPGMDGYSVCRLLKTDPDLSATPVIFTTVRAKVDDKAVGLILGADEYLTKPLDLPELILRISVLLDRIAARTLPPSGRQGLVTEDAADLDYASFVAVAREHLLRQPTVLGLVRVPEPRLMEVFTALRADLRRRDLVACHDPAHLVLLMPDMPPAKAADRLSDIVASLGPGTLPRPHVGLAASPAPGARTYENLLAEADQAVSSARQRGVTTAIAGEEPHAPDPVHATQGTIVLADDDPDLARVIDPQLRAAGFQTVLAVDGTQAMAAVEAHRPDVVIIGMMMPRMAGFDLLARLRDMRDRPRVIVLSDRGREQDVIRAFALGADDYLTKPFSPQELLARLERLIR